jgi:hypothetical protein
MTAWAVAGQSLSLVVGGAGLGLALGLGGMLWVERNVASDLRARVLATQVDHLNTAAALGTCQARIQLAQEGREIDLEIPLTFDGTVLPDPDWLLRDGPAD